MGMFSFRSCLTIQQSWAQWTFGLSSAELSNKNEMRTSPSAAARFFCKFCFFVVPLQLHQISLSHRENFTTQSCVQYFTNKTTLVSKCFNIKYLYTSYQSEGIRTQANTIQDAMEVKEMWRLHWVLYVTVSIVCNFNFTQWLWCHYFTSTALWSQSVYAFSPFFFGKPSN